MSKQAPVPVSAFENHCLEGKLTFGDPFLVSDVVAEDTLEEGTSTVSILQPDAPGCKTGRHTT